MNPVTQIFSVQCRMQLRHFLCNAECSCDLFCAMQNPAAMFSVQCRMQLRLSMDIKALRGPLVVWVPPPPGDRLWFSFLEPPQLQITASPLVSHRLRISRPPSGWPEGTVAECTLCLSLCMPISCSQPNVVSVSCMHSML